VENPRDPLQNIDGAARKLRGLMQRYNGDIRLVLAAYNAGEGRADYYGGVPPFEETRKYVNRGMGLLRGAD